MSRWIEIAAAFLTLGATSYGGPAIMGVMQAELQEKRQWLSRQRFVEGLSVVNMLPGATATQLGIFLGYVRGGWWGGVLAGLCFVAPAFAIMLGLAMAYAALGMMPIMRGALYGLGPIVLGIFLVAIVRLGLTTVRTAAETSLGVGAALAVALVPLGVASTLVAAGGMDVLMFHPRRRPLVVVLGSAVVLGAVLWPVWSSMTTPASSAMHEIPPPVSLAHLAAYFFEVGAFTIGGGLTMIAFIQQQVVDDLGWLTPGEFIDGLALGQLTPGPVLMLAAYVGYKLAGIAGAAVSAGAAFLPSFVIMMAVLPLLDRLRSMPSMAAAVRGMGPAVIGILAVSLSRLAPHALPDAFAVAIFITAVALLLWRVGPMKLMLAGALTGVLRNRLIARPAARAVRELGGWVRL